MLLVLSLLGIAPALRAALLRPGPSPTASGAIVMAIGIFGLAALQRIPGFAEWLTQPLAAALLAIGCVIGASYVRGGFTGEFARHITSPVGRFAVGTWVAGAAVLARMELLAFPEWRWLAICLGALAAVLWLGFIPLALQGFWLILASRDRLGVTGVVLLSTVSTQSVVLVALKLLPDTGPTSWIVLVMLGLGYALYAVGAILIVQRYLRQPVFDLATDWDSRNCILHGAMSITGLTAVTMGWLPFAVPLATWLYVVAAVVAVEGVEVAWMIARIRRFGWRRGLLVYDVTQWSRNFTFGMFYAFTMNFYEDTALPEGFAWVHAVQKPIVEIGPYVVLFFLAAEVTLFLTAHLDLDGTVT